MEWSTFWSAASAVATSIAAVIAVWAMFRWKKQEELKAKLNFKLAVSSYFFKVLYLPKIINDNNKSDYVVELQDLINQMTMCYQAWYMTEGMLEKNENIKKNWNNLCLSHGEFINKQLDASVLMGFCDEIIKEKFVFK